MTPQPAAPLLPRHNRILGRVTRMVTKPWHPYPVGLPFGLGFWIVGLFVATWVLALVIWRGCRIEERWSRLVDGLTE